VSTKKNTLKKTQLINSLTSRARLLKFLRYLWILRFLIHAFVKKISENEKRLKEFFQP